MIAIPSPTVLPKWYGDWSGITTLGSIVGDPDIAHLPQGSCILAVAQNIFMGPGITLLPNFRFILLTQCLIVVQNPDDEVRHAKARTRSYNYTLAHGEISVSGTDGARGEMGQNGSDTTPHTHGGLGGHGGPGGDAGSLYIVAQSVVSRSFAMRADGGIGGPGGEGGYGGDSNPPVGRGGNGGAGGRGGKGGEILLIYHVDQSEVAPVTSARAGVAGAGGGGGLGGHRPPIGFSPDGKPIYPVPNPRAPSGTRGSSGQAGAAGASECTRIVSQIPFWRKVSDLLSSSKDNIYNLYKNHREQLMQAQQSPTSPPWQDHIDALDEIMKFFHPDNDPPIEGEFFKSCRADGRTNP